MRVLPLHGLCKPAFDHMQGLSAGGRAQADTMRIQCKRRTLKQGQGAIPLNNLSSMHIFLCDVPRLLMRRQMHLAWPP